ncbi:MAG: ABC transporter permease [Zestosphaera sp.]
MNLPIFLLKRFFSILTTVLCVTLLLFVLLRTIPGDPARLLAGFDAPPEVVAEIRVKYGLDKTLPEQLLNYMVNLARLDLGKSIRTDSSVASEVLSRLPNTLTLTLTSLSLSLGVGIPLGVVAAVRRNTWIDYAVTALVSAGIAMPTFWFGLILMFVFAVNLKLLPAGGSGTPAHLLLPTLTLMLPVMSPIVKTTRFSMLEALGQDFVKVARAKGLKQSAVLFKHVLRNALVPVATVAGLQLGVLMRGAVITETIFAWPGVGKLVVDAIFARDYPMVQGAIFILALIYSLINLAVDILYTVIDPRVRVGGA